MEANATAAVDDAPAAKPKGKKGLIESTKKAAKWQRELDASKKWLAKFTKTAHDCERAYVDTGNFWGNNTTYNGKVNLFWSNVQVILAAIYGRMPKAEVDRKYKDYDDDVARVASIIMQRILNGDMAREYDDTNAAMRDAVQDRFVVGLGQVWCRYEVDTEEFDQPQIDPATGQPAVGPDGQPVTTKGERITNEDAPVDYVHWSDFRYSPTRRWRDVRWVGRRVWMSEDRLKSRFKLSKEQLGMIPLTSRDPTPDTDRGTSDVDVLKATPFKQAAVWELWSREDNYVCWYCEGCSFLLDDQPDPLELEDFFPCPQPVVATTLTAAFLARADFAMAQDLYKELDRVNHRLSRLVDAVKAVGVYDKNAVAAGTMMKSGVENALIPVDNWSALVEKGGLKGVTDWLPIDQYVNAIQQLDQRKSQLQHDLYDVLGISDIMRGASVASETATAQQLKVQYGGARLSNLQNEVARFVSDVMRIRANIISNLFQPETIVKRSLIMRTPDAQLAQPAIEMLKDFGTAMFAIEVTSDSLAAPDWAAEKEARTEFLGATSNYLMAAAPMAQQAPAVGGFLIKLLQWAAAGFRGAKTIEGVLDEAARQMTQQAQQQAQQPKEPSPADVKDKAQAGKYDAEAERTKKESALIPPLGGPPLGTPAQMGMPQATPGGPQPQSPQPGFKPLGGAPGTVPPMQPQQPMPFNGQSM